MKPKNIVQAKPHTNDGSLSEIKYFVTYFKSFIITEKMTDLPKRIIKYDRVPFHGT